MISKLVPRACSSVTILLVGLAAAPLPSFSQGALTNGARQTGSIAPAGESDSWTFSANAGDGVMVRVGASNLTPRIQLLGPDNSLITEAAVGNGFGRDEFLTAQLPSNGTYTVIVNAKFANQSGEYAISLGQVPGALEIAPNDQGGELQNGAAHAGSLVLGDLDVWTFSANTGENFMVRMGATNNLTPWIRVYSPNGALVVEAQNGNGFGRDDFLVGETASSGTYTVVVTAKFRDQSGEYGLTLVRAPAPFTISGGDEGGQLENGAAYSGMLVLGDLDVWNFTANSGDFYLLRMGTTNATPWIRIYAPNGALAGDAQNGNGFQRDDILVGQATTSGNYTVVVGAKFRDQSGEYGLTLARAPGPFVVSPGDDGGLLTNGVAHAGSIPLGDVDMWSFTADAGDSFMVRMGATNNLTPRFRVYAPNGVLLGEAANGNGFERDDFLVGQASTAGSYTVVLDAKFAGQSGEYGLNVALVKQPILTSLGDEGGALTNGLVHAGNIPVGDLDLWSFTANTGDSFIVRMGATNNLTPWLRVFGPGGVLVGEELNGNGFSRDDFLIGRATNSGTYMVVVSGKFRGQTGEYGLSLVQAPAPIFVTPGDEGGALVNGMTNLAQLPIGDLDSWTFFGTPGDSNVLRVVSTNFTPWIRLYGPDGALVRETTSGNGFVREGFVTFPVTNIGNYTVVVGATFPNQEGSYRFKQSRVPPDLNITGELQIDEAAVLTLNLSAQDPDESNKQLQFDLLAAPLGVGISAGGPTNSVLTWTTSEIDGPSTNQITAAVTDVVNDRPFTRTNTFTVVIREINTPPQLTVPGDQVIDEMTPFSATAVATDADLPVNPLSFALASAPEGMNIDPATGALSWTPSEIQGPSTNLVTVVVTDSSPSAANAQQLSTTNSFTLIVREVNLPPSLTPIPTQAFDELTAFNALAVATDPDLPANTLTFSLLSGPENLTIEPVTGALSWTPSEAQGPSTNVVVIRVQDNGTPALSATNTFTLAVSEVNSPPVLPAPANQTIDELASFTLTNPATDPDLPGETLSYVLSAGPAGAVIGADGTITWNPTEVDGPSTNIFTTVVTDSGSPFRTATNSFTVIVREVNTAPVLEGITNRALPVGGVLSVQAVGSDSDLPANSLTYTLEQAPSGMSINPTTGLIAWTSAPGNVGTHTVRVRVADGGTPALSAETEFQVTVSGEGSLLQIQRLASGFMQVTVVADIDLEYELQGSADLKTWQQLLQFRLTRSPFPYVDTESDQVPQRYYRLHRIAAP